MRLLYAVLLALLLFALAGCGSSNNGKATISTNAGMTMNSIPVASPAAAAPVATGGAATPAPNATSITVTLTEYTVTLDHTSIPAGPVHFIVKNSGQRGHQFQVYPSGTVTQGSTGQHGMPMAASGAVVGAVGFLQLIPVGQTQTLDVTLAPGSWEIACHLQDSQNGQAFDHYDKGMKTRLTVRA